MSFPRQFSPFQLQNPLPPTWIDPNGRSTMDLEPEETALVQSMKEEEEAATLPSSYEEEEEYVPCSYEEKKAVALEEQHSEEEEPFVPVSNEEGEVPFTEILVPASGDEADEEIDIDEAPTELDISGSLDDKDSLESACESKNYRRAVELLSKGEMVSQNSPYRKKLFFLACKHKLDQSVISLIKNGIDFNREDSNKKIAFDYYLEANGNLAELLFKLSEQFRFNLVSGLLVTQEAEYDKIFKGDIMVALTVPTFRELLLQRPELNFLTDNVLKTYAQLCEINPEIATIVKVLNKLPLDDQMDFFNFLGDHSKIKKSIKKAYLAAHPELLDKLIKEQESIDSLIEELLRNQQIFLNENQSTFKKEIFTEFSLRVNKAKIQIQEQKNRIKSHQFWNPTDSVTQITTKIKANLEQLNQIEHRIREIYKKSFESEEIYTHSEKLINSNPIQYATQMKILYKFLSMTFIKEELRDTNENILKNVYDLIYADFKGSLEQNQEMDSILKQQARDAFEEKLKKHIQSKFKELNISSFSQLLELANSKKRKGEVSEKDNTQKCKKRRLSQETQNTPISQRNTSD